MKIVFLSFYSGELYRGVETFVHELSNRLVRLGHNVVVYQNGPELKFAEYKTISLNLLADLNKWNSYVPYLNYYARKVKDFTEKAISQLDNDVDVIFPTNGQWQSLLSSIWAKRKRKEIVISGQSGPGIDDRLNLITFPNTFVGMTDYQVNWAKKANPFVKTVKIPNGVDLNKFNPKVNPIKVNLPRPIILSVAAFDFWKRLDLVIKAMSKLKNGSLLLVGKGAEEKKLLELGNKLLPGRFKIMSFPHYEMPAVYTAADIFTYPTVPWESFGIVLAEAMASGLPVAASEDPIRAEIVGDAGILVDPTKTDEYAMALERALNTEWGEKPRKQAEKFDWDKIAKKYEDLFKELVK